MRNRAAVVIVKDEQVCLIKRVVKDSVYYVFPGGGIEEGESPEEAAVREAYEELGLNVKVKECLAKVLFHGIQYYFEAEVLAGTFGTGHGEEYHSTSSERGSYTPCWIKLE